MQACSEDVYLTNNSFSFAGLLRRLKGMPGLENIIHREVNSTILAFGT